MRRRIFWGTLSVAVAVLVVAAVAGTVVRRQLVDQSRAELARQAEVAARLIQNQLEGPVTAQRGLVRDRVASLTIERTLRLVSEIGGHDYLEAARVTPGGLVSLVEDPRLLPKIPQGLESANDLVVDIDGEPVIATVRTVGIERGVHIRIAIGRQEPLLDSALFTRPMLFALLIGAVLALILAYALARRLGKRLDPIEEAAGAIADGDFGARILIDETDDLGRLAGAFNDMAARLEGAQQRERDFLMSVGHDLRTPLTTIRGYAEGLDAGDIDPEDLPRVATVLHRQTDRLSRLVEDLMLLARLEAREFTLRPEPVDVTAHLKEIVEGHLGRADELRLRLDADLDTIGSVIIDPDRLGQLLGNLIDNAFRYTPEAGTVSVRLVGRPGDFTVSVSDTGPGIDPEDVPRLFERLYVAQRYRPIRPEGSGLGLSIVKELTDAMGGRVDVVSSPGRGTTVSVTMPAGTGAAPPL